jgi:hypothetical protein
MTVFVCVRKSYVSFILFWFFEIGSHCVGQDGLEFLILLPPPAKCWDYRCVPEEPEVVVHTCNPSTSLLLKDYLQNTGLWIHCFL